MKDIKFLYTDFWNELAVRERNSYSNKVKNPTAVSTRL
jgi:hypothetical protein